MLVIKAWKAESAAARWPKVIGTPAVTATDKVQLAVAVVDGEVVQLLVPVVIAVGVPASALKLGATVYSCQVVVTLA